MKHLKKFETYINTILTEEDLIYIDNLFINKLKENNLGLTINNIYTDLELLKKDKSNSFIYWIILDFLKLKNYDNQKNVQNIMRTAMKFFELKYGEVIKKYKEDRKKEFSIDNETKEPFIPLSYNDEIIKVPSRIGHSYIPIKILPIEELDTKYSRHKRLKVFHVKGLKCVRCPRIGKYLIAAKDKSGGIHIDLYTDDFKLMTIDHIKPKSKGGNYDIENLDPMCSYCNSKKANKYKEEI